MINEAQAKRNGAQALPEGFILCVGMRLIIGQQEQQVRWFKGILLAIELPSRNRASSGEKLDLPDVKPGPFIRLARPGDPLALQRAEVRFCRSRRPFSTAGENDIIGDCLD